MLSVVVTAVLSSVVLCTASDVTTVSSDTASHVLPTLNLSDVAASDGSDATFDLMSSDGVVLRIGSGGFSGAEPGNISSSVGIEDSLPSDVNTGAVSESDDCPPPCVSKCCPPGESLGENKICEPSDLNFAVKFFGEDNFTETGLNFVIGNPCEYGRYRLEPHYDSNDEFHVLRNGSLRAPYLFPYPLLPREFCLEVFLDEDMDQEDVMPLVCFKEPFAPPSRPLQYILYPIGLLISVPFLIVTMLVYCLIPELRDLHGKALSCHVMCLAVAYVFLATVQLVGDTLQQDLCVSVAFVIHFSFVACFFWLNVLCFDTWWNVKANVRLIWDTREQPSSHYMWYEVLNNEVCMTKKTERRVFLFYSLYAWCFPILFVIFSMVIDLMPTIPSSYLKPQMGDNKCWFSSEEAELQYFYGPVGFLICVNVVLFILTAWNVFSHEWSRGASKRSPRQMFRMCLTLFGVMGVNWVMEVVSWVAGGPDYIWYFTDVVNTLQGVIIFCIFVLEPRVRDHVRLQLWPRLSEKLCRHGRTPRLSVLYRSPPAAAAAAAPRGDV
ncbi:G-protein coupled receptor Mth2-like [Periplaneta americana]|uniref:G-protein coupled receptor Mth2-like n=1 Tax=Periplaneta americana TaxID=6978 RepID=UPI0037E9750D